MAPSIIPIGAILHHQRAVDFRDLCVFPKGLHHRPQPTFTNFNWFEEFQLGRLNTKIHIQYSLKFQFVVNWGSQLRAFIGHPFAET